MTENNLDSSSSNNNIMDVLSFCRLLGNLKHLPRAGWVRKSVPSPETVSGHMYRMAVLAFFLNDHPKNSTNSSSSSSNSSSAATTSQTNFCQIKCIKMALVHDMAESIVGDITPHCGISEEEKFRRENEAMNHIRTLVPGKVGDELYQLWREYENQTTPEAKAVKELDKFDMIMQAYEYEEATNDGGGDGKKRNLQEFFDSTEGFFQNELIKEWANKIKQKRDEQH